MKPGNRGRLLLAMVAAAALSIACSAPPPPIKPKLNPHPHKVTVIDVWVNEPEVDSVTAEAGWEPRHKECAPVVGVEGYHNVGSFGVSQKVERIGNGHYQVLIVEDQYKKGKCDWENGDAGIYLMSMGNVYASTAFMINTVPMNRKIRFLCSRPQGTMGFCYTPKSVREHNTRIDDHFYMDMEIKR